MTELEKYNLINQTETPTQLKQSLLQIAEEGFIPGRRTTHRVEEQMEAVDRVIKGFPSRILTLSYGIRQQLLYIMEYARN